MHPDIWGRGAMPPLLLKDIRGMIALKGVCYVELDRETVLPLMYHFEVVT